MLFIMKQFAALMTVLILFISYSANTKAESLNKTKKQKSGNRRIQITFINPPHHGKGRSGTEYQESEE